MSDIINLDSKMQEHPDDSNFELTSSHAFPGDEMVFRTLVSFAKSDISHINFIAARMRIVAVSKKAQITGTYTSLMSGYNFPDRFILDSFNLFTGVSGMPDYTTLVGVNRNWKLPDNNEKRTIAYVQTEDTNYKYYFFTFPSLMRWEYWRYLSGVPYSFYNSGQPQGGRNHWWHHYQGGDWLIRYEFELTIRDDREAENRVYVQQTGINSNDYNSNGDWINKSIKTYSGSTLIQDSLGNPLILTNETTKVVASFEKVSAWTDNDYGKEESLIDGFIWLETFENGGVPFRLRASSAYNITPEACFLSIDSSNKVKVTVTGQVVTMEVLIDNTKLPSGSKFTIYARLYNLFPEVSESGTTTLFKKGEEIKAEAMIVTPVSIFPSPVCDLHKNSQQCCYKMEVYADTSGNPYRNDRSSVYRWGDSFISSIAFVLQKYTNGDYANITNLNGSDPSICDFYAFGFYGDDFGKQYTGLTLNWTEVFQRRGLGEGCYRIKAVYTDILGNETVDYDWREFILKEFNCVLVDGTIRLEMYQSGINGSLYITPYIDYGTSWYEQIRLRGILRYKNSSYTKEFNQYGDNEFNHLRPIINEQNPKFVLKLKPVPGDMDIFLATNFLQADSMFVTDYNKNNRHTWLKLPVVGDGDYTPTSNKGNNELSPVEIPLAFGQNNLRRRNSN